MMKLGRLNDARFQVALAKLVAQPMPLRAAFKLKGIKGKVEAELKKFEEVRQGALERFGEKGEDGKVLVDENSNVKFSKENLEAFAKELNDLGGTEVELGTISIGELGDKVTVSADDVVMLDGLLVE